MGRGAASGVTLGVGSGSGSKGSRAAYSPPADKPFRSSYKCSAKRDECGRKLSNMRVANNQGHY